MSEFGVDRAGAIAVSEAQVLAGRHGVAWCGVYIGGPVMSPAARSWSPQVVEALAAAVGWRFLPIYVGQNVCPSCPEPVLTVAQGQQEGDEAVAIMQRWGWPGGRDVPCCLDVEYATESRPGWHDYVVRWTNVVRAAGYVPVLYAIPKGLNSYAQVSQGQTWCWATYWFSDKKQRPGLPTDQVPGLTAFAGPGERAWQYTGGTVLPGLPSDFDLNVSDLALALAPSQYVTPAEPPPPETVTFPETGHTLSHGFLRFWEARGGLRLFGYPISEEYTREVDGVRCQELERARFELLAQGSDPANWDVQLGRVNAELIELKNVDPSSDPLLRQVHDGLVALAQAIEAGLACREPI